MTQPEYPPHSNTDSLWPRYPQPQGDNPPSKKDSLCQESPLPDYNQPVTNQPKKNIVANIELINIPQNPLKCASGLDPLKSIDLLLVHQEIELVESLFGYETQNRYLIMNSRMQQILYAVEDSNCCARNFCKTNRPFNMPIFDNSNNMVMLLSRPLRCSCNCCCPCCLQIIEIEAPPGQLIGRVEENFTICKPAFTIRNHAKEKVMCIKGPFCTIGTCCRNIDFKVMTADGHYQIGRITKRWSGMLREMFTDADFFGCEFPKDLEVELKALLFGACILIDMMFYET